ncbi:MAG: GerMN domain-containing protein [Candidatus Humimicrobiaceae bacterium]
MVRFTFLFLIIFGIGFFIFYSIDNPDFLPNLKSSFSPEKASSAAENEKTMMQLSAENDTKVQSESSNEDSGFLEKIEGFFKKEEKEASTKQLDSMITINFYFCSLGQDKKLVAEERTIIGGTVEGAVFNATREILEGPTKPFLFPVIPGGTKLLSTEVYENVAEVNLSQEFLDNSLDERLLDEYVIYSIVNTLTEIPGINGVIFYIEGKRIKVYGNVDLSLPAIRKEELIQKEEADEG